LHISGLLSALLLALGSAQAAGLGKLSVQSALGQPLRAEIELLSVSKEELSGVKAQLASRELFRQARMERAGVLNGLTFDVAQRANGQPVVRITSDAPVADPFVDLLIELNWNTGRIIREYTLLLDPPAEGRPVSVPAKVAVPISAPPAQPVPTQDTARSEAEPKKAAQAAPAQPKAPGKYGPVKSGETLRSIAGRVKGTEVTLEQMMAGLYLNNKAAFIDSNMNLLKKGAVLQVPNSEAVHLQTSPSRAVRMVQQHTNEWHAYRGRVAQSAGDMPESQASGEAGGGKITPKVEDKSASTAAAKDVLKLSKGDPSGANKPDAKTQERLQALEEELASKSRALQESQDRVSQLERAVRDMQELLQLKSQAATQPPAPVQAPPAPTPAAEEAPPPPPPVAKPAAKPAPLPPPVTPLDEEESWLSTFIRNPIYIGGVVAAMLLSGLLWMMMAGNRRRQGLNKFEDSIMTGGEFKSGAVFNTGGADAASPGANTEGSMLLTDFSRLGLGAIDTHEVDPIAEAEVYMAYGRDAQAEEILKEALDKDSSRHEVALKLLEIYAARKDPLAFETTASELYAGLGGQDTPVWQKAAEMGRSIDPDNPLYRMAQGQAFSSAPESQAPTAVAPAAAVAAGTVAMAAAASGAPDMSMDMDVPPVSSAPEPQDDLGLEFSVAPVAESASHEVPVSEPEDFGGLDFTSAFEPVTETVEEVAAPAEAQDEAVSLDFETVQFEPSVEEEPEVPAVQVEAMEFDAVSLESMEPVSEPSLPADEFESEPVAELPTLDLSDIDLNLDAPALDLASEPALEEMTELVAEPVQEATIDVASLDAMDFDSAPVQELELVAPIIEDNLPDLNFPAETPVAPIPAGETVDEAPSSVPDAPAAEAIDPALWEEVNTKLDLARAYLEMGDREGAREILQEVAQEGDSNQQGEARKLLDEAG